MVVVRSLLRSWVGFNKGVRLLFFAYLLVLTLSQLFLLNQMIPGIAWADDRNGSESDSSKNSAETHSTEAKNADADSNTEASDAKGMAEPEKGVAALPWPKIDKDSTRAVCQSLKLLPELTVSENNRSPYFISKKLIEHKKELQDCYHRFLKIDPNLKGKVVIRLCINSMGLVKEARIVSSDLAHEKLQISLLEIIHSWNDFGLCPGTLGDQVYLQVYEFGLEPPKSAEK